MGHHLDGQPERPRIMQLVGKMLALHEAEAGCDECEDKLACLAEIVAAGQDPGKALSAIQMHLECCHDCREEFEALVAMLLAEKSGASSLEGNHTQ